MGQTVHRLVLGLRHRRDLQVTASVCHLQHLKTLVYRDSIFHVLVLRNTFLFYLVLGARPSTASTHGECLVYPLLMDNTAILKLTGGLLIDLGITSYRGGFTSGLTLCFLNKHFFMGIIYVRTPDMGMMCHELFLLLG